MNLYRARTSVHKGSAVHCTDVPPALRKTACCALPIHSKTIAYIDVSFLNVRPDNYLLSVCRVIGAKAFLLLLFVWHPTLPFVIDFSCRRAVFVSLKRHSLFCTHVPYQQDFMFSGRHATPKAVYHCPGRRCYYSTWNVASKVAHLAILLTTWIWNAVPRKLIQIHIYCSVSCTPPC